MIVQVIESVLKKELQGLNSSHKILRKFYLIKTTFSHKFKTFFNANIMILFLYLNKNSHNLALILCCAEATLDIKATLYFL